MRKPRINIEVEAEFKKKVHIKAIRKGTTVTEVVIEKLTEWLAEK